MSRNTGNPHRRGVTLIELVAVMVAGSVLMGVTISALVSIQRADRRLAGLGGERRAIERLTEQLRLDVHAAQRMTWDQDAERLSLTMPTGDLTTYERQSGRWERRVSEGPDQQSKLAGAYRDPAGVVFEMAPAAADAGSLIRITWKSTARWHDPRRTAPPQDEIVATLGRDLSLLHH